MNQQIDLFGDAEERRHWRYWRGQIYGEEQNEHGCRVEPWWAEVFRFRHSRDTTGWSMASQGGFFIDLLREAGQLNDAEFFRLKRFEKRVDRWDARGES